MAIKLSRLFRTGLPSSLILDHAPPRPVEWLLWRLVRETQHYSGTDWGPIRLARLYSALAAVAERKGERRQAIVRLQRAVDADPRGQSWSHSELARLYKAEGAYSQAIAHLTKALETLEPDVSPETRPRIEAELRECERRAAGGSS